MMFLKLPHVWWHCFFVRYVKGWWSSYLGPERDDFYCSRCNLIYSVYTNEVGIIKEITNREPS